MKRSAPKDFPSPVSRYARVEQAEADSTTPEVDETSKAGAGGGGSSGGTVSDRMSGQKDPIPRSLAEQTICMRFTSRSYEEVASNKLHYIGLCSNLTSIFDVEQLTQLCRVMASPLFNSYTIHDPKYSISNIIMLSDQQSNGTELASFIQHSKVVMFDLTRRAGMEASVLLNGTELLSFGPVASETNISDIASNWNSGAFSFKNGKTNRLWIADKDTDLEELNIRGLLPRLYGFTTDGEAFTHADGPFVNNANSSIAFEDQPKDKPFLWTRFAGLLSSVYNWSSTVDRFPALTKETIEDWQKMRSYAPYFQASKGSTTQLTYPSTTYIKNATNFRFLSGQDVCTETVATHYPHKIAKLPLQDETSSGNVAYPGWSPSTAYAIPAGGFVDALFNAQVGGSAGGTAVNKFIMLAPHYCCRGNPPMYKTFYQNAMSRFGKSCPSLKHTFITMVPMQKASGENILQRASCLYEQEVCVTFYANQDQLDDEIGDNDLTPAVIRGELRPAPTTGAIGYGAKTVFYY